MRDAKPNPKKIFWEAIQIASDQERLRYIDSSCSAHPTLREHVLELVKAHRKAGDFMRDVDSSEPQCDTNIGARFGPFQIIREIGAGGMGVVYVAEQQSPVKRLVALKLIKPGMDSQDVIRRFETESQALARMNHSNIAKVLEAGTTPQGRPFFVMELVDGIPITEFADDQQLTLRERLELFLPVCLAIQHAHQKGMIHRDLKPSNILVARYDDVAVPKVIDFGVAKAVDPLHIGERTHSQFGPFVGTLDYMSPEQVRRGASDIDTRSDIYSLGVVLYQLLAGDLPFDRNRLRSTTLDEMLRVILEEEPPKPSSRLEGNHEFQKIATHRQTEPSKLTSTLRGELDWIVLKAMDKDRERRYASAAAFAEDLQNYLENKPVLACPPSRLYQLQKAFARNKILVFSIFVVACSLVLGMIGTTWQAARAVKAEQAAKVRLANESRLRARALRAEKLAREEALRASLEAEIASETNLFLNRDLLGMADNDSLVEAQLEPDPDIRLRAVLDRAAVKIGLRFQRRPRVEAAIRATLADTYANLGAYHVAVEHAERSLELLRSQLAAEHPDVLKASARVVEMLKKAGHFERVIELCDQCLPTLKKVLGVTAPETLQALNALGAALCGLGKYTEAAEIHSSLLELRTDLLGRSHPDTALSMNNLAIVYLELGRYEEANRLLQSAFAIYLDAVGANHPITLRSQGRLAASIAYLGQLNEAIELGRTVVERTTTVQGEDHPDTLRAMNNLASYLAGKETTEETVQMRKKILATQRKTLGMEHPDTLLTLSELALDLLSLQKPDEALGFAMEAYQLHVTLYGESHLDTLLALKRLGDAYGALGRYDQAVQENSRAVQQMQVTLGERHQLTITTQVNLVHHLIQIGQFDLAVEQGERALQLAEEVLGADHGLTSIARGNLATAREKQSSGLSKD